jgi:hypothetical protein
LTPEVLSLAYRPHTSWLSPHRFGFGHTLSSSPQLQSSLSSLDSSLPGSFPGLPNPVVMVLSPFALCHPIYHTAPQLSSTFWMLARWCSSPCHLPESCHHNCRHGSLMVSLEMCNVQLNSCPRHSCDSGNQPSNGATDHVLLISLGLAVLREQLREWVDEDI